MYIPQMVSLQLCFKSLALDFWSLFCHIFQTSSGGPRKYGNCMPWWNGSGQHIAYTYTHKGPYQMQMTCKETLHIDIKSI